MMRFGAMMAGGVVGLLVLKLLAGLLMPILGTLIGVLMLGLKGAFWLAVGYLIYRLFFRKRRGYADV